MNKKQKQKCVDLMGEQLGEMLNSFTEKDDHETANAIYSEWIVDEQDPEDGAYEFLFINDLTAI